MKRKRGRRIVRYHCQICDRELAASLFPDRLATETCQHLINTCRACMKQWLATQVDNTLSDNISCPECPERMRDMDIKLHAARAVFDKFDEVNRRDIANKTPGWRWCLAPKCRAGQVYRERNDDKSLDQMLAGRLAQRPNKKQKRNVDPLTESPWPDGSQICVCEACGAMACVPCDRPWHAGETCVEYQERMRKQQADAEKNEAACAETIRKTCKSCPSCDVKIEKWLGCDYVHCSKCRQAFCYVCCTSYTVIEEKGHAQGCTYSMPGRFDPHAPLPLRGNADAWA